MSRRLVHLRLVPATPADLPFVERLRRRDARALGFLSHGALAQKIRAGFVWLAVLPPPAPTDDAPIDDEPTDDDVVAGSSAAVRGDGGRPVGFLLHGSPRRPELRIFQVAVDPAYRGRGIARRLVAGVLRRCRRLGIDGVSLRCRASLGVNRFWHRAGFLLHDLEVGRADTLYVWVRRIGGSRICSNGATDGVAGRGRVAVARRSDLQNGATDAGGPEAPRPTPAGAIKMQNGATSAFRFHSRWHRCPTCGRMTCGSWSTRGARRRICQACQAAAPAE